MGLIHPDAEVDGGADIDPTAFVWALAHIRTNATIGAECSVGRGAYIGPGVTVGARTKIQNYALVYEPAVIGEGVFVGPGAILTNDRHPRAVTPDGDLKTAADWDPVGVRISGGASVGAGAICVAPVSIGQWAMVAAGATVVADVPDYALVAGSPARQIGWVGRAGSRLVRCSSGASRWRCAATGDLYEESGDTLRAVD